MRPIAVVLLAAGKGTRMKSETNKVLHPLCGRPMVNYSIELAQRLRTDRVVVVVGHQASQVKRAVKNEFGLDKIEFVNQKTQEGTGHAVWQARRRLRGFEGDVLILSGDVPLLEAKTMRDFIRQHRKSRAAVSVLTTILDEPFSYGRCVVGEGDQLEAIVEEKDASPAEREILEINTGIYLAEAEQLWWALARIGKDNAQGEMYLTDIVTRINERGKAVRAYIADESQEVMGINDRLDLAEATDVIRWRVIEKALLSGVTFIDPATAYLDVKVKVGRDTVIEPGVMLLGDTRVGAGCLVGQGARLEDVRVGKGATIGPYCLLKNASVRPGAIVESNTGRNP